MINMKGFQKLKSEVIDRELCTRCGTCIGVCPVDTLAYVEGKVKDVGGRCVQCGRCNAVCPGKDFPMDEWSKTLFHQTYDAGRLFGTYQGIYNVCPNDDKIRKAGASGGVVTHILTTLLEAGWIDGAVAVREKQGEPYRFEPFIAMTREQLMSAAQSKYVIIPVNQVIREIRKSKKKIAYVGLPCQIQGMRKAMESDSGLAGQIVVLISLFCGFNMEEAATEYLINKSRIKKPDIGTLRYRQRMGERTGFYIRGKNGKEFFLSKHGYTFMNLLFSPKRCWKCFDYSGEFADIAVGDAWEKGAGFSRVVVRTQTGKQIFEILTEQGAICTEPCGEDAIMKTQQKVVSYKKRQIRIRQRRMHTFPEYGVKFEWCRGKLWIKGEVLYVILCFFKSRAGKCLIRLLPFQVLVKVSERLKGREVTAVES